MTERTYTETEVQAIRAAALREAAEKIQATIEDQGATAYPEVDAAHDEGLEYGKDIVLALIDQPADTALNALIGSAWKAAEQIAAEWEETFEKQGFMAESYAAGKVWQDIKKATPADALAALERVKRDTLTRGFDLGFAVSAEGWNGEHPGDAQDTEYYREKRAAAIRGESE